MGTSFLLKSSYNESKRFTLKLLYRIAKEILDRKNYLILILVVIVAFCAPLNNHPNNTSIGTASITARKDPP
jgi:hypothetical protein